MDEQTQQQTAIPTKFCQECGQKIAAKAVICPHCGCQVENIVQQAQATPQIVINNANQNSNQNNNMNVAGFVGGRLRNKWVSLFLCMFLGFFGAHKFYEGKFASGLLYCCTCGLFFFGIVTDFLTLLGKPNPYLVI